jgi:uncharacterized protein YacL
MSCISTCLIGSGFIGSSILTMLSCAKGKKHKHFVSLLDDNQRTIYEKIVNERMSIYVQGLIIGIVLALLVTSMVKITKTQKVCLFIVIVIGFNFLYYSLVPKSTYMLLHTYNKDQNAAWLNIYKEMKMRHIVGFILGILGYYIFAQGICR